MSEACEDRDGRAGGATMLQPVILRLTLNAAAFAAARPTLLFWTLEVKSSWSPSVPTGNYISKNRVGQGWASPRRV